MTLITLALAAAVLLPSDTDPRLATVRVAFVTAGDPLADDRPIAACVATKLPTATPLTVATDRAEADVVFIVRGHLPGETSRMMSGALGSVTLRAEAPDGALLWSGATSLRSSVTLSREKAADVPCALADAITDKLRQAMKKARDTK